MRQDAFARRADPDAELGSAPPASPSPQAEYDALCAALGATARGRAFLDEHARRARRKDTALALQALSRLEEQLLKRESDGTARFHGELRALRSAIVSARTNFTRFEGMLAKRETVMALFDMLELRITEMLAEAPAEPQAANENELLAAAQTEATLVAVHAALVTEQPAPHMATDVSSDLSANATMPAAEPEAKAESRVPEPAAPTIVTLEPRLRAAERDQPVVQAAPTPALSEPEPFPEEIFAPSPAEAAPAPRQDIVALINTLTQAEKIALFS